MDEWIFVTFVPDALDFKNWYPLAWSNLDGWVGINSREVFVFTHLEVVSHILNNRQPINPPFPVFSVPAVQAKWLPFEGKAYFN